MPSIQPHLPPFNITFQLSSRPQVFTHFSQLDRYPHCPNMNIKKLQKLSSSPLTFHLHIFHQWPNFIPPLNVVSFLVKGRIDHFLNTENMVSNIHRVYTKLATKSLFIFHIHSFYHIR